MIESFRNFKVVYRNENVNNSFYQRISAENYHKHKSILMHQNLQERITKLISQGYTSYNNRVISENSNSIYLYNSKLHISMDISACNDE